MLPHIGDDYAVALVGQMPELADDEGGHQFLDFLFQHVAEVRVAPPLSNLAQPGGVFIGFHQRKQSAKRQQCVTDERDISCHVLSHFSGIQVNVNYLGFGGEGAEDAGEPVVQASANHDQDIALHHGIVGVDFAVHAAHTDGQGVGLGNSTNAQQGGDDRYVGLLCQLAQFSLRLGNQDALTSHYHRLFRVVDEISGPINCIGVGSGENRVVARKVQLCAVWNLEFDLGLLHVLADVHQDRAGTAGVGDVEGLPEHVGQLVDVGDQVVVLGDRHGHTMHVCLLKPVSAQQGSGHLAGDGYHGG